MAPFSAASMRSMRPLRPSVAPLSPSSSKRSTKCHPAALRCSMKARWPTSSSRSRDSASAGLRGLCQTASTARPASPPERTDGAQQPDSHTNLREGRATVVRLTRCALVVVRTGEHADRKAVIELASADAQDDPSEDPERSRLHRLYPAPVLLGSPKSGPAGTFGFVEHLSKTS